MRRRAFLGGMVGIASLRVDRAFGDPARATVSVNGAVVPTMQAAADVGGEILLSRGVLAAQLTGVAVGAAHFRKPVMVGGQDTQIADQSIEDKGTFVVDANASFTGLDIAGATGDGIGAAFRHQSGNLIVRRTKIHRCQNGLLGPARFVDCALVVDDCEVFDNGTGTGQTHGLYVGAINQFTCNSSRFRATHVGHHIKSRARVTTISDCQVGTDFTGNESYNVDVPQGGDVTVVGSHMRQGPHTHNNAMLNFGGERDPYPGGSLVVTGTAFESTAGGTGIRIHPNAEVIARLENCMFIGLDVPVEGRCEMKNCRHDGRMLADGVHLRGASWR